MSDDDFDPAPAPLASDTLPRLDVLLALVVCAVLGWMWSAGISDAKAWGWDESMHAELPAARMVVAWQTGSDGGAWAALHSCSQYPFMWPLVLAGVQSLTGISEHACRVAGTACWALTLFGLFLLTRAIVASLQDERGERTGDRWAPWIALGLGACCALALSFAGTLFLEVPATCALVFALWAWVRRRRVERPLARRASELLAGLFVALAFFTKFNYGLLLVGGLALDALVDLVRAKRNGELRPELVSLLWIAAIPLLACLWWFFAPLPLGRDVASAHRDAFLEFLLGNQGFQRTPFERRALYAGLYFALTPRWLLLQLLLALFALRWAANANVRTLLLVALALVVPIATHPFHLERFQIVCGPVLWVGAALGAVTIGYTKLRAGTLIAIAALALVAPDIDRLGMAQWAGLLSDDPKVRAYQEGIYASWRDLSGGRELPTSGLERAEHEQLAAFVAGTVGASERVGWIGMSNGFSPAAMHLALLAHGGSPERFLRGIDDSIAVSSLGADPQWDEAQLEALASRFDVILSTQPGDLKGLPGREFPAAYRERLVARGWKSSVVGRVSISRPLKDPLDVALVACRRP